MASITIRNLDEQVKTRLRVRAAEHGRSMEEEAREILTSTMAATGPKEGNLFDAIRARIAPLGGVELPAIARDPIRPVELDS